MRTAISDPAPASTSKHPPFWTLATDLWCQTLACTTQGLSAAQASERLDQYGPNADKDVARPSIVRAIFGRLIQPLSLILISATCVSVATGDDVGGIMIGIMLFMSVGLDTLQEDHAMRAAEVLRQSVALKAEVKRDGAFAQVVVESLVPGDVIRVRAGDIIPADGLVLTSEAFTANEAALTGEPYPVEKRAGAIAGLSPGEASNAVFRGAVAQTGEALALVIQTGRSTLFGIAAAALDQATETSPFQRDLQSYGSIIARMTIALVVVVMVASVIFGRPLLQSLLFGVALAVGLTPELLPMITTVTLARGAARMAKRKVIVKRLASIHDLGAMTVLCTDKTGTLTSAEITLDQSLAPSGDKSARPALLGGIAASLGGDRGALDAALTAASGDAAAKWTMRSRRAFDFDRRLGSVLADGPEGCILIAKGAPEAILALCTSGRSETKSKAFGEPERKAMLALVHDMAEQNGLRTIAVASRPWVGDPHELTDADEGNLIFEGLCAFADPPKPSAPAAIARLAAAGIRLKILSGDDPVVVKRLAAMVGLNAGEVLSGTDVAAMDDATLAEKLRSVDVYGRMAPEEKSRLIKALQKEGEIVGYLGDGINDAPAMQAAHIGLSVAGATGVAQAAADMILLDSDLAVVADGVEEGRRTFANIIKYIWMEASSNFGNMLSVAVASLFLPFLPMLPTQILLNNLLYDISQTGIPFDSVAAEAVSEPQIWDGRALVRFAAIMGSLSSIFDLALFGGLYFWMWASPIEFRTAWFVESMASQILVIFIIRTKGRPWANRPHPLLTLTALTALTVAMILPFSPLAHWLGFEPLSTNMMLGLAALIIFYLTCAELLKRTAIRPTVPTRSGRVHD